MWWQSFFDSTYLQLWAHQHPPEQCQREAEQLIERLALRPGDTVLDAPCGYGRISVPLAQRGISVTGVDYSADLLAHAEKVASSEQLPIPIRWQQADTRTANLGTGYAAAINLFSSLGYGTEDDDLATLRNLHGALAPGGKLFIETMHRDVIVHSRALGKTTGIRGPAGLTLRERNHFDPVSGTIDSTWTWTSPTIAGSRKSTIRLYSITELVALVHRAGFTETQCFAGLGGPPFTEATLDQRLGLLCVAGHGSAGEHWAPVLGRGCLSCGAKTAYSLRSSASRETSGEREPSMNKPIRRVAVIGSGVMGAGIAAHVANAGLPVLLLDILPSGIKPGASKSERNSIAANSVKALLKSKPAALFNKSHAALIEVGNIDDDLERAAECDLIVEAIIERLDIKRGLFARLEPLLGDSILASNTSGLRIVDMLDGRSEEFKQNFLVMHFFNPPRYMKLLELVAAKETSKETVERVEFFGREELGKGIVWAKDEPNFVANRIGTHSMMTTVHLMLEEGLTPEDIDAITGVPMAHPKSATFRTADMVGLDTLAHVVNNCYEVLVDDEDRDVFKMPAFLTGMLDKKLLGRKTGSGIYRKTKAGIETIDLETLEYRPKGGDEKIKATCKALSKIEDPGQRLSKTVASEGMVGKFAWTVISRSLAYAARRVGEICDDITAIDKGMCWGYNWDMGPFQVWDALGFVETYDRMVADGISLPDSVKRMRESGAKSFYKDGEIFDLSTGMYTEAALDKRETTLHVLRRGDSPVLSNKGAEAWDLGDGVLGVTFKTKMNSIDADVIGMLHEATDKAERDFSSMLITNQGDNFCVGANLFLVAGAAAQKQWDELRQMVGQMQDAMQRLKYSTIPVIAAPHGMTLGGGMELCFACDGVQAAAETYSGLVEVGVGLIPGGAGNMNMLWRALEGIPQGADIDVSAIVAQVFKNIAMAAVATSANEAKEFGYFRHGDGVSFDRARQLWEAKQRCIGMANSGYHPSIPRAYRLPGDSGIATIGMLISTMVAGGYASEHDALISGKLAEVLCGGKGGASHKVTEQEMLDLEAEAFVSLCGEPKTMARIQHMLMKNKPLRN